MFCCVQYWQYLSAGCISLLLFFNVFSFSNDEFDYSIGSFQLSFFQIWSSFWSFFLWIKNTFLDLQNRESGSITEVNKKEQYINVMCLHIIIALHHKLLFFASFNMGGFWRTEIEQIVKNFPLKQIHTVQSNTLLYSFII